MLGRIFQAWQSGYRKTNMALGSVWGRGWAHVCLLRATELWPEKGVPSVRSTVTGTYKAAGPLSESRASWAPSECSRHLASSCLSIYFCQTVRNIRHHIQGYFLDIEVERALEIIVEKSLEMFLTLNLLLVFYFLPLTFPVFPPWACGLPTLWTILLQWEDSGSSQLDISYIYFALMV